jgi:predicted patatin/cPLA2 family phospholipase
MDGKFRVLSLDGGGMRGLYTASLLHSLARLFDERFCTMDPDIGKSFDLICGTSTGSILACGLAAGVPIRSICNLYIEKGPLIFRTPKPGNSKFLLSIWLSRHLFKPAALPHILQESLDDVFKDLTLGELFHKRNIALCIPTIDAADFPDKHRDKNYKLSSICMASSAAPVFFPLSRMSNPDNEHQILHFVDGGLWANNPVMIALTEALQLAPRTHEIEILSVGTCDRPSGEPYTEQKPLWGLWQWQGGVKTLEMSLKAQSYGYNSMVKFLARSLSESGRRIEVVRLEEGAKSEKQYNSIGLDRADDEAIKTLINLAEKDASTVHSTTLTKKSSHDYDIVESIFKNMKALT